MNAQPPFFPLRPKNPGDRVKLPKRPASPNTEYWYGHINAEGDDVVWDNNERPDYWAFNLHLHSLISV